jgi:hypothetical protein
MHTARAAILLQRASIAVDRQADICFQYCLGERWAIQTIVPQHAPEQAAQLVRDGHVQVVVVAFEGRNLADVVAQVADAGGRVMAVHPEPRELTPNRRGLLGGRVSELILRWYRKGRTASQIAELVDADTTDITSVLVQFGLGSSRTGRTK